MLCWKLGEPRSGVALLADVVDAVLMVVVHKLAVPLGQAFGGLVTRKLSDSDRFFTWCITPGKKGEIQASKTDIKKTAAIHCNSCNTFIAKIKWVTNCRTPLASWSFLSTLVNRQGDTYDFHGIIHYLLFWNTHWRHQATSAWGSQPSAENQLQSSGPGWIAWRQCDCRNKQTKNRKSIYIQLKDCQQ